MTSLYTLGYSGWQPNAIKSIVEQYDALLLDIRYSPTSRSPHWRKAAFHALLGDYYVWLPELGNINYRNGGAIRLNDPDAAIPILSEYLATRSVIMMCGCRDHTQCHRTVAARVVAEAVGGLKVTLLYP